MHTVQLALCFENNTRNGCKPVTACELIMLFLNMSGQIFVLICSINMKKFMLILSSKNCLHNLCNFEINVPEKYQI